MATSPAGEPSFVVNDTTISLCVFRRITVDDVVATIRESPSKQCSLDPLPTWLLKDCVTILEPYITNIINISLSTGVFPKPWKHALISSLLKKAGLDEAAPANFRPVSNLPFLSKLLKRVVHRQLAGYLNGNNCCQNFSRLIDMVIPLRRLFLRCSQILSTPLTWANLHFFRYWISQLLSIRWTTVS